MNNQWSQFVEEVKELYGKSFVPLHEPTFHGNELSYVSNCITTGWVSSVGEYVNRYSEQLAAITGASYAIPVVNGTAALQVALRAAGVQQNDEVLMPSLTFIATANAASYLGAIPHFVDVSEKTLGLDPYKLRQYIQRIADIENGLLVNRLTGRIIRAVVPMHTFGHPVELDALETLCSLYNLTLIEDAAESLGSYYKGRHTGTIGKVSALSFNGNKIITTGGGGAILTNDEGIAEFTKHITTTAKLPHRWNYIHDDIGYNFRMPNLNAALGCAQLENLSLFVKQKRSLVKVYERMLHDLEGVTLFKEPEHCESNYWLQTIILDDFYDRDEILTFLNDHGIMSRPIWEPLHHLEIYKTYPRASMDTTEKLHRKVVNIPSTPIEGMI